MFILFNNLPELLGGECFHAVQNIPAANIVRRMGSKIKSSDRTEEIRSVFWLLGFCLMQPAPLWIILPLCQEIEKSNEFKRTEKLHLVLLQRIMGSYYLSCHLYTNSRPRPADPWWCRCLASVDVPMHRRWRFLHALTLQPCECTAALKRKYSMRTHPLTHIYHARTALYLCSILKNRL